MLNWRGSDRRHAAVVHGATVGSRVLIGIRAVLLNGCTIGEGSIIGAGAVVTENAVIPPNSLVVGVPGKVIRETTEHNANTFCGMH